MTRNENDLDLNGSGGKTRTVEQALKAQGKCPPACCSLINETSRHECLRNLPLIQLFPRVLLLGK